MPLRLYQKELVFECVEAKKAGARVIVARAPTGSGKTHVISFMTKRFAKAGLKVMAVAHRNELWRQLSDSFYQYDISHGRIARNQPELRLPVQVASIGSLVSRFRKKRLIDWRQYQPDVIFIDEGHHVIVGNQWGMLVEMFPRATIYLFTATPARHDNKGLGAGHGGYADVMVSTKDEAWMIENGYLTTYKPHLTNVFDLAGMKPGSNGEYNQTQLKKVIASQRAIVGDMVQEYGDYCQGESALVFAPSVDEAEKWASDFRDAGFDFRSIDGKMDINKRTELIKQHSAGNVKGLVSCDLISEGTDIPRVGVIFDGYPTGSLGKHRQKWGRGLRLFEGKEFCRFFDHAGNTAIVDPMGRVIPKHGFPDTEVEWSLESGAKLVGEKKGKKEGDLQIMNCPNPQCQAVHKKASKCPECGHVYTSREIMIMDGQLQEMERQECIRIDLKKKKDVKKEQNSARTLVDLIIFSKSKGRKPLSAFHLYNSRVDKANKGISETKAMLLDEFDNSTFCNSGDSDYKNRCIEQEQERLDKAYPIQERVSETDFWACYRELKKEND